MMVVSLRRWDKGERFFAPTRGNIGFQRSRRGGVRPPGFPLHTQRRPSPMDLAMCLLTPRQASSRHSSSKLGFALGSLCHSHESTSPTFHHLLMILSSLCIVDADGSESRLYAKHIASDRGAMRRCVLGKRNDVGASEMRPHLPPTPMVATRWQGCAMPDFFVWGRIATDSRKAAPCGVLP